MRKVNIEFYYQNDNQPMAMAQVKDDISRIEQDFKKDDTPPELKNRTFHLTSELKLISSTPVKADDWFDDYLFTYRGTIITDLNDEQINSLSIAEGFEIIKEDCRESA